jgi:hypothetical protein
MPTASAPPLVRGMWAVASQPTGELGVEKREGGPRKWEAQAVRRENGQRLLSLPIFFRSFFLHPPLTPITPRLPPLPPPSRPNASRRWLLSSFRRDCHHHHLPRIQTRAGGGSFRRFDVNPTTTTSLASKREPEVVLSVVLTRLPPSLPPSHPNTSRRWFISSFRRLPPPPPPSHPNASRRWFISVFRRRSHLLLLPRIQTRAGGGFFVLPTPLPPPPPPSCPNASQRWLFLSFRHDSHYHHLPRVQTRVGGGCFRHFDAFAPPPPPSHSNASRRRSISLFRHTSHHHHLPHA